MKRFFVIEGLDSSGKSTQIELLVDLFNRHHIKFKYMHFPRTGEPGCYGDLISRFLRGEFGQDVDPYLIALMFAADRNDAKEDIRAWIDDGYLVFADRYYYSNIAFQGAKITDISKRLEFRNWLKRLEVDCNQLPIPSLAIYLKVPFNFIESNLTQKRLFENRQYLGDAKDIHEMDLSLQRNVDKEYENLLRTESNFLHVDCTDNEGEMMPPSRIHSLIVQCLIERTLLSKFELEG